MTGMTIIVKTISSWVKVLIIVFGIYIILFGHLTPGGGFAGGVILASSYILLMLAFGRKMVEEIAGLFFGGSFFVNVLHQTYLPGKPLGLISAGTIPLSNIAIGLKVGASLFLVTLVLSVFRMDNSTEKKE